MAGTTTAGKELTAGGPWRRLLSGDGANRWVVLVVLLLSLILVALDSTILHIAVPSVTEDLRPGSVQLLWIVDSYPLVCASLLILFGTLGDRVGRRRVLMIGYALFTVASAMAALAKTPELLITARVLLGVGGAMIMPATLSIVRAVFPDRRERSMAIGIWSAVTGIGAAAGPVLGGFLVENFWWGSVFLINIPLMLVIIPLGRLLLPESKGSGEGPWDVVGALMASAGVLGVVYGVKRAGSGDPTLDVLTIGPLVAGAVLLLLFVRRQRRIRHPLIDMKLFSRAPFTTSVGCIVLGMLALVGLELIAVQYLQLVLHLSPLETGMRLLPLTFAAMVAGGLGSYVLQRVGPRAMVAFGFTLTAASVTLLTMMGQEDQPWLLAGGFILLGFGLQATLFGSYESMLSEAPADSAGGAAAIGETAYQLGAGMGIALLGSVMNAAYGPGLKHVEGVAASDSKYASNSLGEAYEVAKELGGAAGKALYDAARVAFVHGLHVTLLTSAGLLLVGAIAALKLPRGMDADRGKEQDEQQDEEQDEQQDEEQDAEPAEAPAAQVTHSLKKPEPRTLPAAREPAEATAGRD
ncbi:MFS transporter [Streptomyces spiroverticillatus]|uniref:MFS transporter n=1 Tax=Streptomyces finlayi TaxID=67296 RepID=A0A918X0V8_9ACTN|nr:MFS transporter [Streptomyces finlayi]GHA36841.1 MFS transporter [Streptomyces spiroverticillatus]GHD01776.1 MFS transporter [Streptomyces finlayi]